MATFYERRALRSCGQDVLRSSLFRAIEEFTGTNPTEEQATNWLRTNHSSLGKLAQESWSAEAKMISCQADYNLQLGQIRANIYLAPTPSKLLEVSREAMLISSPPIPNLWLYVGHYQRNQKEPLAANIAHNTWLAQAIERISTHHGENVIPNFIIRNKPTIDRIRQSFQISEPKPLGGGADGVAFDIGGRVLKIFKDKVAYEKAKDAFDRLHTTPALAKTEAMLYDVGVLGFLPYYVDTPTKGIYLYYYIMEKMKPVYDLDNDDISSSIRGIISGIASHLESDPSKWKTMKSMIDDPNKAKLIKTQVRKEAITLSRKWLASPIRREDINTISQGIRSLKSDWLPLYIEEVLMKYLTGRGDLHLGNLGITPYGELRYFDPAYHGYESEINI